MIKKMIPIFFIGCFINAQDECPQKQGRVDFYAPLLQELKKYKQELKEYKEEIQEKDQEINKLGQECNQIKSQLLKFKKRAQNDQLSMEVFCYYLDHFNELNTSQKRSLISSNSGHAGQVIYHLNALNNTLNQKNKQYVEELRQKEREIQKLREKLKVMIQLKKEESHTDEY